MNSVSTHSVVSGQGIRAMVTTSEEPVRASVLMVHGLGESASSIAAFARAWAGWGILVVAPDLRGHGRSARFSEPELLAHPGDVWVRDVLDLLGGLDLPDAPILCAGHSAGGGVAAAVAAALGYARGVFLVDPFWRFPVTPYQKPSTARSAAEQFRAEQALSIDALAARLSEQWPRWSPSECLARARSVHETQLELVADGHVIPREPWPGLVHDLVAAGTPVDVVTGTVRCGIKPMHRTILKEAGAQVHIVEGAGHFIRRDAPDALLDLARAFVDRVLPSVSTEEASARQ
ncbi:Lysophospholipase, alpha-beta hydrolase superfamily [Propionibacterium cyclohexanicum]|uniref:Lysophospholipase, alpha-beta hydrolase superfamily n=1 Tax=Propionibacterium cyclohexanicum TaxID=64702 RepID=A0A1H9QV53_9ACTN|nr:alpha/beta fold hydrolase [Propionibacterium cyclohexanicum]SER64115.1 Lysophospholipase, alpha-beta hydrolase superfamily [Propionibacterium cyclohexanicum]